MQLNNTKELLQAYRNYVVSQSRANLTRDNKNVTKELYNSVDGGFIVGQNSFSLWFDLGKHGEFQDKGVKGKVSSLKAPNSPFKFGSGTGEKGGLTRGIDKWVKARRFQFRNKENGKIMSYEQTANLITRSIYLKGMKPSLFFTKPFEAGYKKYIDEDLIKRFALDVDNLMNFTLKK